MPSPTLPRAGLYIQPPSCGLTALGSLVSGKSFFQAETSIPSSSHTSGSRFDCKYGNRVLHEASGSPDTSSQTFQGRFVIHSSGKNVIPSIGPSSLLLYKLRCPFDMVRQKPCGIRAHQSSRSGCTPPVIRIGRCMDECYNAFRHVFQSLQKDFPMCLRDSQLSNNRCDPRQDRRLARPPGTSLLTPAPSQLRWDGNRTASA